MNSELKLFLTKLSGIHLHDAVPEKAILKAKNKLLVRKCLQYSVLSVILEKLITTMMAPIQTVWHKVSTWGFNWRKFVPFWKEDPPTLTSLTGKR